MESLKSSSTIPHIQVGSCRKPNSYDFISQMNDDVLIKILSLMPIKDAAVTSGVATKWRYLWRNLKKLNFDGSETFRDKMDSADVVKSESEKFINQVNSVIQTYNHQIVRDFRIRYGLNDNHRGVIHNWLVFAMKMKVEFLELDLTGLSRYMDSDSDSDEETFDFPTRLYPNIILCYGGTYNWSLRLPRCYRGVEVVLHNLKKLILKRVNVMEEIFHKLLENSPNLEMISIHDPLYLDRIIVGGQRYNLKHFEIVYTSTYNVKTIYLSDFDLVSFTFKGHTIDLRLENLPKVMELDLDVCRMHIHDVFVQISSCALSLESLLITAKKPKVSLILESFPHLPNLKRLRFAVGGSGYDCLLFVASIINACPKLETFSIKPCWTSPIISRKIARGATNPHKHLKLVNIVEYKGRKCDFELAAYIIESVVALKKIVIAIERRNLKKEEAARSCAERIRSIKPQGVELVIV